MVAITWAENLSIIPEEQAGFRSGRGCGDNVFNLLATLQIAIRLQGSAAYSLFVDLRRAFDSVPHDKLWSKLYSLGLSPKLLNVIKALYDVTCMQVRVNGELSKPIDITSGVLQGETLSPILFVLYISDLNTFLTNCGAEGLSLGPCTSLLCLKYADDLVLLARTPVMLRRILKFLERYCDLNDLTVNTDKTKILKSSSSGRINSKDTFKYKEESIEVVKSFEYLGVYFTASLQGDAAALSAVKKSKLASGAVLNILSRLKANSWKGKTHVYNCLSKSMLLYLAHIWCLSQKNIDKLESAQMDFYKRLFCLPFVYPRLRNKDRT
ncbi:Similar to Transposon TX1 uncharacterized 149 kDa protein (Xenopus laevis) [Cotesia congregata]|uniref:Similar to Transposon TX1 uncharacterized 149 kDa protein (Xenopus laevis) n=1 Tax=Cotesia congregata TaxID=51543 RepID=A0A8J2H8Q6_COTCN|nr:Similar to Transposon TX1 uncharacterized 149 kDa protein (Xenopus laevis) [Cotesia congregata]